LEALLQELATLLQTRFGYEVVLLCLMNEELVVTQMAQAGEVKHSFPTGTRFTLEEAIGNASARQQAIWVKTAVSQPPSIRPNLLPGMHSELALPLVVAQKTIGVMDIQSQSADAFDADHMLVLQSLAAQTAVTIRNATLYQREVGRRHMAETLYNIGLALSGTLNRAEVLSLILEQLASVVPYDRAALMLHHGHELEFVAARGFPEGSEPLQIRVSLHQNDEDDIYLTIHRTKNPLVIPDVAKQPNWIHVEGLPVARSWLGVPLLHRDQVIGMLSLVRETADAYSEEDIVPATTFAVQAAVALHNAELYNRIDQFNRQLAYEVEQRTEAVLQLARLDQAKSDFIDIAAHELRTPLTTIKGYSQMLLQDLPATPNATHRDLASAILRGANRLHEIVNNMLNVAKIDNETLDLFFQTVSLPHLLERVCLGQQEALTTRDLKLVVEPMENVPDIEGDVDGLQTVFSHLLVNAIKYTPDGGCITISHQMMPGGETAVPTHIEIIISDTGIGIPLEAQELIFAKFYQTGKVALHSSGKTKFKGGGPGLGLAIVRGIIEAHNGRVWVTSAGYDEQTFPGSQFHIVLPLKQP
jgi:signal transduction histidine kinase